jgi:hypothetical protein
MDERVLHGLTILFYATAPLIPLIYWLIICRRLYRHGARFPTGLIPWRFFGDLIRYRESCQALGDSLSGYYVYWLLFVFDVVLGIGIILGHLWRQSNPWQ